MKEFRAKPIESSRDRVERARNARRGVKLKAAEKGHIVGVTMSAASGRVHLPGSIAAQLSQGESTADGIREDNIRYQKIAGRGRRNILFLMDTSGSMLSADRLAWVKGCVVSLLEDAYVKRIRVAVIGYGGGGASLVLPFTSSPELAASRISEMKGGGTTPLAQALGIAGSLIERMPDEAISITLLSDGRYDRNRTGLETKQIRGFGEFCFKKKIPIVLIDAGAGNRTAKQRAALLARMLHAKYRPLESMRADLGQGE